jgi:hypothetical protein
VLSAIMASCSECQTFIRADNAYCGLRRSLDRVGNNVLRPARAIMCQQLLEQRVRRRSRQLEQLGELAKPAVEVVGDEKNWTAPGRDDWPSVVVLPPDRVQSRRLARDRRPPQPAAERGGDADAQKGDARRLGDCGGRCDEAVIAAVAAIDVIAGQLTQ